VLYFRNNTDTTVIDFASSGTKSANLCTDSRGAVGYCGEEEEE
jgi:hypothetical protein